MLDTKVAIAAVLVLFVLLIVLGLLVQSKLNENFTRNIAGGMECPKQVSHVYYDEEPEIPERLPFKETKKSESRARHIGQLKLLLSEIEFLTRHGNLTRNVVYIAAAPGDHIPFLAKLFPKHIFHLYDPAKFTTKGIDGRIYVHNQFFTDETAEEWREKAIDLKGVLLISDIRSSSERGHHEDHVEKDNEAQRRWCETICPLAAMLKFRWPFKDIGDPTYLDGKVMIQAFPPQFSAETRLIVVQEDGKFETRRYDVKDYEERMFYHNAVTRNCVEFPDMPWHDTLDKVPGMTTNYDCARMVSIVDAFLREAPPPGKKLTMSGVINEALKTIKRSI